MTSPATSARDLIAQIEARLPERERKLNERRAAAGLAPVSLDPGPPLPSPPEAPVARNGMAPAVEVDLATARRHLEALMDDLESSPADEASVRRHATRALGALGMESEDTATVSAPKARRARGRGTAGGRSEPIKGPRPNGGNGGQ